MTRTFRPRFRTVSRILIGCICAVVFSASTAASQTQSIFASRFLPFLQWPQVQGEVTLTPTYVWIAEGRQTIPSLGFSWGLRDDFGLTDANVYLDGMFRFQFGRVSLRAHVNLRDFSVQKKFQDVPGSQSGVARFEYSGYRLGGDLDLLQFGNSRIGANVDQDMFPVVFTESIQTLGGKKIIARSPVTIGAHVVLRPIQTFYGFTPIFEARARWPIAGADLTDWYIAAGFQGAETYLGTLGLRAGFRSTSISFSDSQFFNAQEVSMNFNIVMDGLFGELVYYY